MNSGIDSTGSPELYIDYGQLIHPLFYPPAATVVALHQCHMLTLGNISVVIYSEWAGGF